MGKLPLTFDDAITIVPRTICDRALAQARQDFQARFPDPARVCLMPVLRGGRMFGEALGYPTNPIRMSYYRGGERLPQPICLQKPDPALMVGPDGATLPVVLAEGVIETFSTIHATVGLIEALCKEYGINAPPHYEAWAVAIKSDAPDNVPAFLPDPPAGTTMRIVAQVWVHIGIWIHGMGTDDGDRGREVREFRGRLSPFAEQEPDPPYYTVLNPALRENHNHRDRAQVTSAR